MPRQSNGAYVQPANTSAISGQPISSSSYNSLITDISTEMTNSVDRLGRAPMQANLSMASYNINNLATPLISTDAANKAYADTKLALAGGTLTGVLAINSLGSLGYLTWYNGTSLTASWGGNASYSFYVQNSAGTVVASCDASGNFIHLGTVTGTQGTFTGALSGASISTAGTLAATGAATVGSLTTGGAVTATGAISSSAAISASLGFDGTTNAGAGYGSRVRASASGSAILQFTNNAASASWGTITTADANTMVFTNGGGGTLTVANGNVTASQNLTAFSDARLKENVRTIEDAASLVNRMRGVWFTRKDSGAAGVGVIAQEMREVVPEVVHDTDGTLSVAYQNLVGVLIENIKELNAKVAKLEAR